MSFATPIVMASIARSSALAMSYLEANYYSINSYNNVDLAVFKLLPELFTLSIYETNREVCTAISLDNVAFVNLKK